MNVSNGPACQGSDTIVVTINQAPVVDLGPPSQDICIGQTPSILDAGNPGALYYHWYFNGVLLPNDTLQTLVPDTTAGSGIYSVIVSTGGSCIGTDSVTFTINTSLPVNLGPNPSVCQNDTLILNSGVTASSYQWFDTAGDSIAGATGATYQVPTNVAGTFNYSVTATSASGCTGTGTVTVTVNAAPVVTLTGNTVACITDTLFASSGGVGTYQWLVDGNTTTITTSTYIITQTDVNPHVYTVIVTNAGCASSAQISVTVYPNAPTPTPASVNYCSGTSIPALDAGVTGVSYLWSTGETTQTIIPPGAGTYTITVSIGGGVCTASASATVTEVVTPQPVLNPASACP